MAKGPINIKVEWFEEQYITSDSLTMEYAISKPHYIVSTCDVPKSNMITLEAGGPASYFTVDDDDTTRNTLNTDVTTKWLCDYCGRRNKRKRETCRSCGAVGGG
jgi:hypothetical protein